MRERIRHASSAGRRARLFRQLHPLRSVCSDRLRQLLEWRAQSRRAVRVYPQRRGDLGLRSFHVRAVQSLHDQLPGRSGRLSCHQAAQGIAAREEARAEPLYRKFRTDLKYNVFSALRARDTGDITNVTYIQGEANLGGAADRTAFFPGCALYAYAPELTAKVSQWLRDEALPLIHCSSAAVRPFTMSASMPNTTPIASACRLSCARGISSAWS